VRITNRRADEAMVELALYALEPGHLEKVLAPPRRPSPAAQKAAELRRRLDELGRARDIEGKFDDPDGPRRFEVREQALIKELTRTLEQVRQEEPSGPDIEPLSEFLGGPNLFNIEGVTVREALRARFEALDPPQQRRVLSSSSSALKSPRHPHRGREFRGRRSSTPTG
jgi:hypothetical protein